MVWVKAKLQAQLGINDDKKAQDIFKSYDYKVPFVKKLIKQVMNRAQDRGRVRTLLGRSCRFHLWEPAQFGVQTTATQRSIRGTRTTDKKSIYIQSFKQT